MKSLLAGVVVLALAVAGLVRGASTGDAGGGTAGSGAAGSGANAAAVQVTDAWIAAPVPPTQSAAGYFTAYNPADTPVTLLSVVTGAGTSNVLHTAGMAEESGGVVIGAHQRLVLSPGNGHVMITGIIGTLSAGQKVTMMLTFANEDPVSVLATVYGPGDRP